MFVTSMRL